MSHFVIYKTEADRPQSEQGEHYRVEYFFGCDGVRHAVQTQRLYYDDTLFKDVIGGKILNTVITTACPVVGGKHCHNSGWFTHE